MVLLPCLGATQQDFEENSANALIALRQNEIVESEITKQIGKIGMVASIAAILVVIGTVQPLLLMVPLVIAWIGISLGLALMFSQGNDPGDLMPLVFPLFFAGALVGSPFFALYMMVQVAIEGHL